MKNVKGKLLSGFIKSQIISSYFLLLMLLLLSVHFDTHSDIHLSLQSRGIIRQGIISPTKWNITLLKVMTSSANKSANWRRIGRKEGKFNCGIITITYKIKDKGASQIITIIKSSSENPAKSVPLPLNGSLYQPTKARATPPPPSLPAIVLTAKPFSNREEAGRLLA